MAPSMSKVSIVMPPDVGNRLVLPPPRAMASRKQRRRPR